MTATITDNSPPATPGSSAPAPGGSSPAPSRSRERLRLGLLSAVILFTGRGTSLPFRGRWRMFQASRVLGRLFGVSVALEIVMLCARLAVERRMGEEGALELLEHAAALAVDYLPTPQPPEGIKLLLPFRADAKVYVERYDANRQPPITLRRPVTAAEAINN